MLFIMMISQYAGSVARHAENSPSRRHLRTRHAATVIARCRHGIYYAAMRARRLRLCYAYFLLLLRARRVAIVMLCLMPPLFVYMPYHALFHLPLR